MIWGLNACILFPVALLVSAQCNCIWANCRQCQHRLYRVSRAGLLSFVRETKRLIFQREIHRSEEFIAFGWILSRRKVVSQPARGRAGIGARAICAGALTGLWARGGRPPSRSLIVLTGVYKFTSLLDVLLSAEWLTCASAIKRLPRHPNYAHTYTFTKAVIADCDTIHREHSGRGATNSHFYEKLI